MSNYIIHDGELYHYGRKGMKWGQNIYGKVKTGVKKAAIRTGRTIKYNTGVAARGVKKAVKTAYDDHKFKKAEAARRNKPISKLTDAELKDRINRLQMEQKAFELQKSVSTMDKQTVSIGKKFISSMASEVLAPALISTGKNALMKLFEDKFDNILDPEKFERDALKNEVDMLDLKVKKKDHLNKLNSKPDPDLRSYER